MMTERRCGTCRWWDEQKREAAPLAGGKHWAAPCDASLPDAYAEHKHRGRPLMFYFLGAHCPTWQPADVERGDAGAPDPQPLV